MDRERVRAILGVWMPMVVGLWIIATAVGFYLSPPFAEDRFGQDLESWRLVCSAGTFFVGGLLLLSTYGRYKKAKLAKETPEKAPPAS